ncbi:hypothetical protein MMG00_03960 [Ignatzschineria rhizosphaerae]|uniref:Type 1 fimbrial protein n=1 Tax=Ignatzschineria rhizosphaerae TaxID=2923279 RepID=A0ABY3X544_9GAMM|nr:hypothetical protein [Ignatzschineria rhizosphaerae]UNM97015.1 hypothetical protein MMG00_03960 [Ignatzschineria rhizosphaerae]
MKKLLYIFSLVTLTMSLGYAQNSSSFQVEGEITSDQRCQIGGQMNIDVSATIEQIVNNSAPWGMGNLSLTNCDLSVTEGHPISYVAWSVIPDSVPGMHQRYWNIDSFYVYLEFVMGGGIVPPTGIDPILPEPYTPIVNGSANLEVKARLVHVAGTAQDIKPRNIHKNIHVVGSYR